MRELFGISLLCFKCIVLSAYGDVERELCGLPYDDVSAAVRISWASEDRRCLPESFKVTYYNSFHRSSTETKCLKWQYNNMDSITCIRGPARGDWLQEAVKMSLRTSLSQFNLLLCFAEACYPKNHFAYEVTPVNDFFTSTTNRTTSATTHDEAVLDYFERLYNETLQSSDKYDDDVQLWAVILTSVFFAFFAILAAYESLALMFSRLNSTESI